MRRNFLPALLLATLSACSQPVVTPISQETIGDIRNYFWNVSEHFTRDSLYEDSFTSPLYALTFSSGSGDTLLAHPGNISPIICTVNSDSIFAANLSPDGPIQHDYHDYFIARDTAQDGGLLLLKWNLFSNDSSWQAGTLIDSGHRWSITGRVMAHFDSLITMPGKAPHSFSDVLMIRYANESANEVPSDQLPYWVIYYAKGIGPIMFDNVPPPKLSTQLPYSKFERFELGP